MTDSGVSVIWAIGGLVLVGSSLLARRLPLAETLRMALAWIAIFSAVFVLFLFRDEGREVWRRATAEISGNGVQVSGSTMRIPRDEDGHYWVRATVNGVSARFLIDSGATTTTISPELARAPGVEADGAFKVMVDTANGTVTVDRATVKTLVIGDSAQSDVPVVIGTQQQNEMNLLGMSFLSSLRHWRVEGTTLILQR